MKYFDCPYHPGEAACQSFYVTFGGKYRTEPHPTFREAHPDGYVRIEACCEEDARSQAKVVLGRAWSHLYLQVPEFVYAPRGEIGVIENAELRRLMT